MGSQDGEVMQGTIVVDTSRRVNIDWRTDNTVSPWKGKHRLENGQYCVTISTCTAQTHTLQTNDTVHFEYIV